MSKEEFVEWCYNLHLQNINEREGNLDLFRKGIECAYDEVKILNIHEYDTQVYDEKGETIATIHCHKKEPKTIMIEGSPHTEIGTYRLKNAQLIAAAPDMIDVLLELQESASYWGEYDVPVGIVDRINEVIAKAIG